ncbi:hypothetical protein V8C37DRAFT_372349 [Trichoderma ceciliae]
MYLLGKVSVLMYVPAIAYLLIHLFFLLHDSNLCITIFPSTGITWAAASTAIVHPPLLSLLPLCLFLHCVCHHALHCLCPRL